MGLDEAASQAPPHLASMSLDDSRVSEVEAEAMLKFPHFGELDFPESAGAT